MHQLDRYGAHEEAPSRLGGMLVEGRALARERLIRSVGLRFLAMGDVPETHFLNQFV